VVDLGFLPVSGASALTVFVHVRTEQNSVRWQGLRQSRNIGCGQGDLYSKRRIVGRGGHDGLFQMFSCQSHAGEGEPGRAGFQFAVSLAVVVLEKAAGQAERLFVKGEAGGDIDSWRC